MKPSSNPFELAIASERPHFQRTMSQFITTLLSFVAAFVVLISAAACGSNPSPAAPSTPSAVPASVPRPTSTFHATGIVTDDDGSPVTGAMVTIRPFVDGRNSASPVLGMTDGSGFYSIDFDANRYESGVASVKAARPGYDPSHNIIPTSAIQDVSQNVRIYRIKQVIAGESTVLTVLPGDTLCGDNDQFVCRTVHIAAPADGLTTLQVVPTPSAANAGLEILGQGSAYYCCAVTDRISVTAGTEVVANIGMWWTSTA
jgi:hypothetical protein